jgi:hypothetical protein
MGEKRETFVMLDALQTKSWQPEMLVLTQEDRSHQVELPFDRKLQSSAVS